MTDDWVSTMLKAMTPAAVEQELRALYRTLDQLRAERPEPRFLAVTPDEVARERERGWRNFHPEAFCHDCGQRNIKSWSVAADDWTRVADLYEILCPQCFTERHEAASGQFSTWVLVRDVE